MATPEWLIEVTVLEQLDNGTWLFAFTAEGESFKRAIAKLKQVPAGMRRWCPEERCWWFSSLGMLRLRELFPEVREALTELAGAQIASIADMPAEVGVAFATLHLLPSAPLPIIKAAYRALASIHHPDHGGNHDAMLRVNAAYTTACKWATRAEQQSNGGTRGQKAGKAG